MIQHRRFHLWIALWLAVVLPISTFGPTFGGNSLRQAAPLGPISSQSQTPAPHEEDENHSSAKLEIAKAIARNLRRFTPVRQVRALPTVATCQELLHTRSWNPSGTLPLPTPVFLDDSLSRRGPPAA